LGAKKERKFFFTREWQTWQERITSYNEYDGGIGRDTRCKERNDYENKFSMVIHELLLYFSYKLNIFIYYSIVINTITSFFVCLTTKYIALLVYQIKVFLLYFKKKSLMKDGNESFSDQDYLDAVMCVSTPTSGCNPKIFLNWLVIKPPTLIFVRKIIFNLLL